MPNYRRAYVPGGTFFFTVVTYDREPLFAGAEARGLLGGVLRRCFLRWPVEVAAIVLLPDHLHTIWSLPTGDRDFSVRWGWIKKEFTKTWLARGGSERPQTTGENRERRRGVWQPRFWEHMIRDEEDFERHLDYIHYNPVKHGLAASPREWEWSSFGRWVQAGVYPENWACGELLEGLTTVGE